MQKNNLMKRLQGIIQYYDEIIIVIFFAIILGFINSVVDTRIFGGTYFQNMFQPNYYQILERFIFIIIALLFGFIWHRINEERKEKDREIYKSELMYRTLAKTAGDGIISVDTDRKITLMNKAAENIFGYTQDEILGEDVKILIPEEYIKRHDEGFRKYLETGTPKIIGKTVELEGLRKDGLKFPLELSLSVSVLDSGSIFTAIIRDITKRVKLKQELKEYCSQLEESNQQKELYMDIMSHDLLNSVTVIYNVTELLMGDNPDNEVKTQLEMIIRNAAKLNEMIVTASKYAKLSSVDELKIEENDLAIIIKNAVGDLNDLAAGRGVEVESRLDRNYLAKMNPFLNDVFLNLISNAIKYSPENSKIIIDIKDDAKNWKISVKDFGDGIPDEYKKSIFQRFERIKKGGVVGFGLGLAVVKRIVDLHKGDVWVEDNPEGGSIFFVRIPKAK